MKAIKSVSFQACLDNPSGRRSAAFWRHLLLFLTIVISINQIASAQQLPDLRTMREKADDFMKSGDYRSANASYESWVQACPRDTMAHYFHALCLVKVAQSELALKALEQAAIAGLSDLKRVNDEPEFAPLRLLNKWKEVQQRVNANARENAEFPFAYCKQERMARYRVLYPSDYDSTKRYPLILLLHGNGQTPAVMLRWMKELKLSSVIVVCPEAPYAKFPESIAHGQSQLSASPTDLQVPDTLRQETVELSARWYADVLTHAQRTLPLTKDLPLIIGFSQGGFYSLVFATRFPERIRSVIALSPSYFEEAHLRERAASLRQHGIDVLHCHGKQDPIVPFQTAELIHDMLSQAGVTTSYVPFDGIHWMTPDINQKVQTWIHAHFHRN